MSQPDGIFVLRAAEVFSWLNPDTKDLLHFDVEGMRSYAELGGIGVEKGRFSIEPAMAEFFLKSRGVDTQYVMTQARELHERLVRDGKLDFANEKALKPMIGVQMSDGTQLTVDGHHRAVLWAALKMPWGLMWLFTEEAVKPFLLDMPASVNERLRLELSQEGEQTMR